jgi:hypothetical protein
MRKRMREPSCYSFISFISKKLAWRAGSPPVAGERWYLRPPAPQTPGRWCLSSHPPPPRSLVRMRRQSQLEHWQRRGLVWRIATRSYKQTHKHYAASSAQHVQQSWLIFVDLIISGLLYLFLSSSGWWAQISREDITWNNIVSEFY